MASTTPIFEDPSGSTCFHSLKCDPSTLVAGGFPTTNCSSAILGGPLSATGTHCNCADYSVILMGNCSLIDTYCGGNGCFSSIINGDHNCVAGISALINNGCSNQAYGGSWISIGNGSSNAINGLLQLFY